MKFFGIKRRERVLSKLREALRAAQMNDANFDGISNSSRETQFIRERTRLYRESWIIEPLQQAIAELEK